MFVQFVIDSCLACLIRMIRNSDCEEAGASKNEEAGASHNEYRCHHQRVDKWEVYIYIKCCGCYQVEELQNLMKNKRSCDILIMKYRSWG